MFLSMLDVCDEHIVVGLCEPSGNRAIGLEDDEVVQGRIVAALNDDCPSMPCECD